MFSVGSLALSITFSSVFAVQTRALVQHETQRTPTFDWDDTRYVYAFGDSYTFVQGTRGHANFSFIGDAFDISFTPRELLTDSIIPKNTSSDGSNWIEFLTGCLSGRPSNCSPHQLWDFAFAGADIDSNLLPLHHNFTVSLVDQVKHWAQVAADVIPHPSTQTLTAWWIGINDTGDTVGNATITSFPAFWETEMSSYFNAVEMAFNKGLQGTHLFINVPPEERAPGSVNDPTKAAILRQNIVEFNAVLAEHVQNFTATHQQTNVLTFDAHTWFNDILDNAAQYGFTNITGFCTCRDDSFFWFDSGHPTEKVHKLLAGAIEQHLRNAASLSLSP